MPDLYGWPPQTIRGTALTDPIRYPLLAQSLTVAIAIVAVALMPLLPNRSGSGSRPSSSWLGVLFVAIRNARRFRAPRRRRQMDVMNDDADLRSRLETLIRGRATSSDAS